MLNPRHGNAILLRWLSFIILLVSVKDIPINYNGNLNPIVQKGLHYLRAIGIPSISEALLTLQVPNFSGKTESPIGDFRYTLSNIAFNDVLIPASNLSISQMNEFDVEAINATLSIDANWTYRQSGWPHLSDSGSCHLALENINVKVTCQIDSKENVQPKIQLSGILLKVGHMKLRFHGGASWLYNVFADSIASDIQKTVEELIKNEITSIINRKGSTLLKSFQNFTQ